MRSVIALALLVASISCTRVYNQRTDGASGGPGTSPTPLPVTHTIEYRVVGGPLVQDADITYSNAQDGTTTVRSTLPWAATLKTTRASLFVSLQATTSWQGKLTAQVFVDGELWREATGDFSQTTVPVLVSGTVVP